MHKVSVISNHLVRPLVRSFDDPGEAERYIIQLAADYAQRQDAATQDVISDAGTDINMLMYVLGQYGVEIAYWQEEE